MPVILMGLVAAGCSSVAPDPTKGSCFQMCHEDSDFRRFLAREVFEGQTLEGCSDHTETCICAHLWPGVVCEGGQTFITAVQFDRMRPLGLTPVKETASGSGVFVPACDGGATNVRLDFNLMSTQHRDTGDGSADRDVQIRPGDRINKVMVVPGETLKGDDLAVDITCLEAHDGNETSAACDQDAAAFADVLGLHFTDHLAGAARRTPVGVAIVMDQSGSTVGLVDGAVVDGASSPGCIEGTPGAVELYSDLNTCASDLMGLRLTAAKDLIEELNPEDPAVVFAFSEAHDPPVWVACEGVDAADQAAKGEHCYSNDRTLTLGGANDAAGATLPSAIDQLSGQSGGRANLWASVGTAFAHMEQKPEAARHIVVIADGPDTCGPSSDFQYCFDSGVAGAAEQTQCAGYVGFDAVRSQVMDYVTGRAAAGLPNDLHVSFIHFQSAGYLQHDPRMMELACMTGGQYRFLNLAKVPQNSDVRRKALGDAARDIRASFSGHWSLQLGSTVELKTGDVYAAKGLLTLNEGTHVGRATVVPIDFGEANLDSRLSLRVPCANDADCGGLGGECGMVCDGETRTCLTPPDGASCTGGACCGGACRDDLPGGLCTPDAGGGPLSCP